MGDGNAVNAQYQNLHKELSNLQTALAYSDLSETEKSNLVIDIESLNVQLAKLIPDKSIIGLLWRKIEETSILGGFADFIYKISHLTGGFLPNGAMGVMANC